MQCTAGFGGSQDGASDPIWTGNSPYSGRPAAPGIMTSLSLHMPPPPGSVLLHDPANSRWELCTAPLRTLAAGRMEEVVPLLRVAEEWGRAGVAAGFVSYEAGPAFDSALKAPHGGTIPLAWFAFFQRTEECRVFLPEDDTAPLPSWAPSVTPEEYVAAVARVKDRIRDGDTYQVNLTFRLSAPLPVSPWHAFLRMISAQPRCYGAYMDTGAYAILSASPELFFRLEDGVLVSKPMKGTAPRAPLPSADRERALALAASEKERAENVMIVDMVRNDCGRIARSGSVEVTELFAVERHPTVWQMTSTVRCETAAGAAGVFGALFPPASITGAPKARTMEIIGELESTPRGVYCGAVGRIGPGGDALFNVAIRTQEVDLAAGTAVYGVGSGVTWQSEAEAEYRECLVKGEIVTAPPPSFSLLETMLWTPGGGFPLLDLHLGRLAASAEYFDRPFDQSEAVRALMRCVDPHGTAPVRVRLLLDRQGRPSATAEPLAPLPAPWSLVPARSPVSSADLFLYHKTTFRRAYDRARADAPGAADVLLWNERGEITETLIANVALRIGGELLTPPVTCGLLPGVRRQLMLDRGDLREQVLRLDDLGRCTEILCFNAVRGAWRAEPVESPAA